MQFLIIFTLLIPEFDFRVLQNHIYAITENKNADQPSYVQ